MEKWLITRFWILKITFSLREKRRDENVVIKEDFCGACLALPLAFAGAGTATATSGDTSENKSKSSIFFWSVVISIIGLIANSMVFKW